FIANQQGDLIYALSLQEGSRSDLVTLLYQGNLLDRAEPIRNLVAAMAIAGLLDYRKTYDEYERLNDDARRSADFGPYAAVKAYERDLVQLSQKRVADLEVTLGPTNRKITRAEARLRSRHQYMIILSSAGAFFLLLANLVEHGRTTARPE